MSEIARARDLTNVESNRTDTPKRQGRKPRNRRIPVRISYDADLDFLWVLKHGEDTDGQRADETDIPFDDFYVYHRGPSGPVIGFGVDGPYEFELPDPDHPLIPGVRFDAATLGLRNATAEEVLLAACAAVKGYSTPDQVLFDLAVEAGSEENDELDAEILWRQCLAAGDMKAHFGLGYTLCDEGRHHEAYGHLAEYARILPRNSWAWAWLGQAAEGIGEPREAARCYRRAIRLAREGSFETDAGERLEALKQRNPRGLRRR